MIKRCKAGRNWSRASVRGAELNLVIGNKQGANILIKFTHLLFGTVNLENNLALPRVTMITTIQKRTENRII